MEQSVINSAANFRRAFFECSDEELRHYLRQRFADATEGQRRTAFRYALRLEACRVATKRISDMIEPLNIEW